MAPGPDDKFLLKPRTYLICKRGHIRFAKEHPSVTLWDEEGKPIESAFLCPSCQYETYVLMFGAVLMPNMITEADAKAAAADMKAQFEAENPESIRPLMEGGPQ